MIAKWQVAQIVRQAIIEAQRRSKLPQCKIPEIEVIRTPGPEYGDFATNIALQLSSRLDLPSRHVAESIVETIDSGGLLGRVEVAGSGFVNMFLSEEWLLGQVDEIIRLGEQYFHIDLDHQQKLMVEFVSANPTGPLHIGHGRNAAIGDCLARVFSAAGYQVSREFYINDSFEGGQIEEFARSLYARCAGILGIETSVSLGTYLGEYMDELAREIAQEHEGDLKRLSEQEGLHFAAQIGLRKMLDEIRKTLELMGIQFDVWFSEQSLYDQNAVGNVMELLRSRGHIYDHDGAVWLRTKDLGDDRDRVLVRRTGRPTYFGADIAYHYTKFIQRPFDHVVNIWGADHHGYIGRMKAALQALDVDPERLTIVITQLVTLMREGIVIRMSKRAGKFVTLKNILEEVGPDAARHIFLSRDPQSPLDFDIAKAREQSDENPAYYIQYAHTRLAGILRRGEQEGIDWCHGDVKLLRSPEALSLLRQIVRLPEVIESVASTYSPQHLVTYGMDLARLLHSVYQGWRVVEDGVSNSLTPAMKQSRLKFVMVTKIALSTTLGLLGMSAPEQM